MSINNINNTNKPQLDTSKLAQQQVQNQSNGAASQAAASQSAMPAKTDSVSLTSSAQQLSNVQSKSAEAPVNQEKVERLKKEIAEGDYKVNPETLAQNIAAFEAQILGTED